MNTPKIERPPLPLSPGHLAMLLAGGACDGYIQVGSSERALVKGRCSIAVRRVRQDEVRNQRTGKVANIKEIYRTCHDLTVRVLRESGQIEDYSVKTPEQDDIE